MYWLKNSNGKPSATLTFSTIAFFIVMIKVMLTDVAFTTGDKTLNFGTMDAGLALTLLTPTLGAYIIRRWNGLNKKEEEESTEK
jgi:hypothetical protein